LKGKRSSRTLSGVDPVFVDTSLFVEEEFTMPRHRTEYPEEFRRQVVELHRAGRSARSLAKEFEPSEQTIRNWMKQADLDAGERKDGLTSTENDELRRLRRENKQLKMERDILSKAAAWFARETGTIPEGSSGS
jgi:transposase